MPKEMPVQPGWVDGFRVTLAISPAEQRRNEHEPRIARRTETGRSRRVMSAQMSCDAHTLLSPCFLFFPCNQPASYRLCRHADALSPRVYDVIQLYCNTLNILIFGQRRRG